MPKIFPYDRSGRTTTVHIVHKVRIAEGLNRGEYTAEAVAGPDIFVLRVNSANEGESPREDSPSLSARGVVRWRLAGPWGPWRLRIQPPALHSATCIRPPGSRKSARIHPRRIGAG